MIKESDCDFFFKLEITCDLLWINDKMNILLEWCKICGFPLHKLNGFLVIFKNRTVYVTILKRILCDKLPNI